MQKRKFPLINIVILVVIAIVFITVNNKKVVTDERNCSYIIGGEMVVLVDGQSDIEIVKGSASRQLTSFIISQGGADLNGDGRGDSLVYLRQTSGGSGTFYYIAAALGTGRGYRGTNAVFLGDRIEPLDITFEGSTAVVSYLDRADGESFSVKPSVEKFLRLKIEDGQLTAGFE